MAGMSRKKRILLTGVIGLGVLLAAAGTGGWLVYTGRIRLNHPSPEKYPVRGVDVSHYQGAIDWQVLSAQSIQFAYIKATEGSSLVDEYFAQNWKDAHATALYVGAYHFFSFDSPGRSQAEQFIRTVPVTENALPPVIDLEYYGDKAADPPARDTVRQELDVLIQALKEHYGKTPVIYTTYTCYREYLKGDMPDCAIWYRSVYAPPLIGPEWVFWQYRCDARLPGYAGNDWEQKNIDLNVYRGSYAAFLEEFGLTDKQTDKGESYVPNAADRPL